MKFTSALIVAMMIAQTTATPVETERNLKSSQPPKAKGCKLTPKCKAIGGIPTTLSVCKRYKGYHFVSNTDFGGNPEGEREKNCGCCFLETDPVDVKSISTPYFQLESVSVGTPGTFENFQDETTRIDMQFVHSDKGGMDIKKMHALVNNGQTIWGFNAARNADSRVSCDAKGTCRATIKGHASSEYLEKIAPGETYGDVNVGRVVDAVMEIEFQDPKQDTRLKDFADAHNLEDFLETSGDIRGKLIIMPTDDLSKAGLERVTVPVEFPILTRWRWVPIGPIDVYPPILFHEPKRNLCVQPIRVRNRECIFSLMGRCMLYKYEYSGAGLDFGRPGAEEQWGKVDVTFTWKPWKTIIDNAGKYRYVTEAEMADLKAEVADDPTCIEVYFVKHFSPASTYGGGATWGSGTASAKIITSDEQVGCGVDKTHLAHELGHVLGLMHPGTGSATYADGSTGTLMCPSGWERDNPRRNSRDNGNNIVNPLLTSYLGPFTLSMPDCTSSADCGSCSAHYPSDSC